jgi:hypothetical protein
MNKYVYLITNLVCERTTTSQAIIAAKPGRVTLATYSTDLQAPKAYSKLEVTLRPVRPNF